MHATTWYVPAAIQRLKTLQLSLFLFLATCARHVRVELQSPALGLFCWLLSWFRPWAPHFFARGCRCNPSSRRLRAPAFFPLDFLLQHGRPMLAIAQHQAITIDEIKLVIIRIPQSSFYAVVYILEKVSLLIILSLVVVFVTILLLV